MTTSLAIDTSAIVAILTEEPEAGTFKAILNSRPVSHCSAATFVETLMVLSGRIAHLDVARFEEALRSLAITQCPVDVEQSTLAVQAFLRFGKGRHPANLNFGDCFSYALAKSLNAPLLYKGDDFVQTDIVSAVTAPSRP